MKRSLHQGLPALGRKVRGAARLSALAIAISVSGIHGAFAGEYTLGAMDKLRIRVAEWQTAEGSVRDWSAVSGDYTVGASGAISLPFLGTVPASGKTTSEIADEVGLQLQKLFGLPDRPSASVELAQYRPIYLAGEVQTPGEYPFAPDLTVLKAVSLGGGLRRGENGQRFARDFINAQGDSSVQITERNRLLVRRARLQAEIAEKTEITLPAELKGVAAAPDLLESEMALMVSRDKRQKLQLTALAELKSLLQSEIEALGKKSVTQTRQLELVVEDKGRVDVLAEKGLALSARKLAVEQRAADLQAALLDIDTASLKAKQAVSQASQDETNLRNDWDAQLAQELQNTEAELDTLALKLITSRDLMTEALVQSADAAQTPKPGRTIDINYSIIRQKDGKSTRIAADEGTPVQPGDVVKVEPALNTQ
ncbi:polysaccharide export protein [Rhizobium sp. LjRoot98]|uniref:polysaccharide biosynthesis/export family protein n=1 Tax=unclassified Rhizobium TaxID=2613769 RepID=UPI000712D39D|nr:MULTISPECIES: polysaccharide biosynthesis/export family protein [unclassified Rhizobium]KQV41863.1 sugar ABC transporter substrate-binding protein [Rhizobium sp. Root1204]KQY17792.1 sugar ABC transporter substrate-binding protein [Rhizobium sp. Root1334]KRC13656.1 sugar ABC transporter substrate-binding protein [Rhizobium sp. Root73]